MRVEGPLTAADFAVAQESCLPPAGTPPDTTCWLRYDRPDGQPTQWLALIWTGENWSGVYDVAPRRHLLGLYSVGPNRAFRFGWRFHSIAQVPE